MLRHQFSFTTLVNLYISLCKRLYFGCFLVFSQVSSDSAFLLSVYICQLFHIFSWWLNQFSCISPFHLYFFFQRSSYGIIKNNFFSWHCFHFLLLFCDLFNVFTIFNTVFLSFTIPIFPFDLISCLRVIEIFIYLKSQNKYQ